MIIPDVNFLPWRENHSRKQRYRFYQLILLTSIASLVAIYLQHAHLSRYKDVNQQNRVQEEQKRFLVQQKKLELNQLRFEEKQLIEQIDAVQRLRSEPMGIRQFIRALPNWISDNTFLVHLELKLVPFLDTNSLKSLQGQLSGESHSLEQVSALVEQMQKSLDIDNLIIDAPRNSSPQKAHIRFSFSFLHSLKQESVTLNEQ